MNRYSGIVGVFHLQGASWSRTNRQFVIHDAEPSLLANRVAVRDVELLSGSDSGGPLAQKATHWAAFNGRTKEMHRLPADGSIPAELQCELPEPLILLPRILALQLSARDYIKVHPSMNCRM